MPELSTQRLSTIEIFCKASELGSFARTAEVFGLNPSAVSKAVSRLEDRLGVKLFHRTTRSLQLTKEGALYFERCRQALGDIEDAEILMAQGLSIPRGLLRVSLPVAYGTHIVVTRLHEFFLKYPEIELELDISDRLVDLVEENIDIAVRVGTLSDSNLMVRSLGSYRVLTVASPDYLKQHGIPQSLEDLKSHNCIRLLTPRTGQPMKWVYYVEKELIEVPVKGSCITTGADTARILAVNGVGIARLIEFVVQDDLAAGRLQLVLENFESPVRNVAALYKQRQHISLRVQLFLDFLGQLH